MPLVMKLKDRRGQQTERPIGGFRESGAGYQVREENGEDIGYFGPDQYESIIFEIRFDDPSPR